MSGGYHPLRGRHCRYRHPGVATRWRRATHPLPGAPCHIALLAASTIADNLVGLVAAGRWQQAMPTNLLLVSGPSKTADIQQTLAYGAHGPSRLLVVLVEDC